MVKFRQPESKSDSELKHDHLVPKKIAFVTTMGGLPWGGSEELWSRAAIHLRNMGHPIGVSLYKWPSRPVLVETMLRLGVAVTFRPRKKSMFGRLTAKLLKALPPFLLADENMAWLRRESPRLVVISQGSPWEGLSWMSASRRLGLKYCIIIHANSETFWPVDEWRDGILNGFPNAERVFFVSQANKRLMEMQCGFPFVNGEIVINPWNTDASEAIPWPEENGVIRIACVGRLDPKAKGQDLLLQVLAMPKWQSRPIHLRVYGSGPCRRTLEGLQQMLGLRNVTFAGHVSDVRRIWADNHALVLPSRFEGLPLVIVEAMLCGRLVITTDVAGNAEYLQEGVNGFVAEAPTCRHLDDALERAWSRRSDWESMGAAARRDVRRMLPSDPIEVFAQRLLDLIG